MPQYFDNVEGLKSKPRYLNITLNEHSFSFKTDSGIFSKDEIDRGSIALLNVLSKQELAGEILDLGCGYGTLGIVLSRYFPDTRIYLADINKRACALARENALLNHTAITVIESDCFSNIERQFDTIVINPPIRAGKKIIYKMFLESYKHLNPNGSLYFVIRKSHGAESAQKYTTSVFQNCTLVKRDKGYYIYRAVKLNNQQ